MPLKLKLSQEEKSLFLVGVVAVLGILVIYFFAQPPVVPPAAPPIVPIKLGENKVEVGNSPGTREEIRERTREAIQTLLINIDRAMEGDRGEFLKLLKGTTTRAITISSGRDRATIPANQNFLAIGAWMGEYVGFVGDEGGGLIYIQLRNDMSDEDWTRLDECMGYAKEILTAKKRKVRERVTETRGGRQRVREIERDREWRDMPENSRPEGKSGRVSSYSIDSYTRIIDCFSDYILPGGLAINAKYARMSDGENAYNNFHNQVNLRGEVITEGNEVDL